jgi:hypothetical protein
MWPVEGRRADVPVHLESGRSVLVPFSVAVVERVALPDHEGTPIQRSITMAKTVIGLFDDLAQTQHIFQSLVDHGFDRGDLSVIAHRKQAAAVGPTVAWAQQTLSISGLGPVLAAGPLAAELAEVNGGPTATSLLEALRDRGVPMDEAHAYVEGVRRGGALVAIDVSDADADRAVELMSRAAQPSQHP